MRRMAIIVLLGLFIYATASAQNSRTVLTGTVVDDEAKVIPNAAVTLVNTDTGVHYQTVTDSSGMYIFADLPPGKYEFSVEAKGLKATPKSRNIIVSGAQILNLDEQMYPGAMEVDVDRIVEPPALQKLDSQQMSVVTGETLDSTPLLGFPSGEGRIRNPLNALLLTPGSLMTPLQYFRVNGSPSNTESLRIDGQEVNNGFLLSNTVQNQVGVDAVQEFSILTGNYAAEYGQAGGGIVGMTMKSGSNVLHGSAYDYWANEALNASQPFTNVKPRDRRNDYGFTLGGPVVIPSSYNGRNKTFFFFSFEQFRQLNEYQRYFTVPTAAYRSGDFRQALTGRRLGTDALGRAIMEGTIYDSQTQKIVNGQVVRDPFPGNVIPNLKNRIDSVAGKIQSLLPMPNVPTTSYPNPAVNSDPTLVVDNYLAPWKNSRLDSIGSIKINQNFARSRVSFYYGFNRESVSQPCSADGDCILAAIAGKPTNVHADTFQLNFEHMFSPVKTFNAGIGYQGMKWRQDSALGSFDQVKSLGLTGANFSSFPYITGLNAARGGMEDMGTNRLSLSNMAKPSVNASLTWVRNHHIYKFGMDLRVEGYPTTADFPANGFLNFSADQTGLPLAIGQNLAGGTVGFPYASFLLGLVNNGDIGTVSHLRLGKHSWALFAQDSWRATPRLTLEYGLRYDYQTYLKETHGRVASFSPTALNPLADNLPGAIIYEGKGAGHCNCDFANVYPFAFGPRLGLSIRMTSHMVFRAGMGIVYGQTATDNGAALSSGSSNPYFSTIYDKEPLKLGNGFPSSVALLGSNISPVTIDRNAGRPPRQIQWSLGFQSEMGGNVALEIAYVGNRGAWWESSRLINVNAITLPRLYSLGLDLDNASDRSLLASAINSPLAVQRGFSKLPYAQFPTYATVAQSLRPFPQYGDIYSLWAPLGRTWYDAVQLKLTKRYSHGFEFNSGFTYQREWAYGNEDIGGAAQLESINNISVPTSNRHISALSQPYKGYLAASFTFPKLSKQNWGSELLRDWKITAYLEYASGLPIPVPTANSNLYSLIFQHTYADRVGGQSFYTKDINSNSFNPKTDFVLNPQAWTDPAAGQFSTSSAYESDYRFQRRPLEQFSFGRTFRIHERFQLNVRADFQNIFNRREMADPVHDNAGATQVKNSDGAPQSGFGFVDYKSLGANPRNGQIVVRFQF
jgi:hypothetical protein